MTFLLVNRVRETTISPGTGTATLAGAALGYQTFSAGVGANNTTYYVIADQSGANWEVGYGTVGALGTTLARTTVLSSSNGGSLVNFSSGTQDVWVDYPATKAVFQDSTGTVSVPVLLTTSTTNTTPNLSFNASNSGFSAGASISGNYLQAVLQNKSGTAGASTNYVLSNDLGTDSTYYGEFGMNSSVFSASTPTDFFSINNGVYFSGHDGDITVGSGNGFKTYLAWGTAGQSAHVINAVGALGFSTNLGTTPALSGATGYGTAGQVPISAGSTNAVVWSSTPTLTGTNFTGVPISTAISGLGTGVATALAVAVGSAGAFVVNGGALGTPSSGTLTNTTGFPAANLAGTALPAAIVSSSLTSVGTITTGTWSGLFGAVSGANLTNLTAGNLTGTIPSAVLGNSTLYVGTTAIALNRASAALTLTGVSLSNLTIGTGLSGTSYNGSSAVTIANTGVTSVSAGAGISVSASTGGVTITNTAPSISATYLVVAGGGGGGSEISGDFCPGGGGAGGMISGNAILVSGVVYTVTVGAGGAGGAAGGRNNGVQGSGSSISGLSVTSIGGGYGAQSGGGPGNNPVQGGSGGSGGGSNGSAPGNASGGSGTTGQGNNGGTDPTGVGGPGYGGSGGGGAGAVGGNGASSGGGAGGIGLQSSITGSAIYYAGGGGGGTYSTSSGAPGGSGGGGTGGNSLSNPVGGTANLGGGGGGAGNNGNSGGGAGGSGVVIISIPTSVYTGTVTGSPTVTTSGAFTIIKFTSSGTYTA